MKKIILQDVTVKGFDPDFVQEKISKNGKPYTKSFVTVVTTDEQKDLIFEALEQNRPFYNQSGDSVFDKFGKIPCFNAVGEKITDPLNFEFIADVAVMVEYSGGFSKTECLGIKFKSKVDGGAEFNFRKNETFDEIFAPEEFDYTKPAATPPASEANLTETISNDLPF